MIQVEIIKLRPFFYKKTKQEWLLFNVLVCSDSTAYQQYSTGFRVQGGYIDGPKAPGRIPLQTCYFDKETADLLYDALRMKMQDLNLWSEKFSLNEKDDAVEGLLLSAQQRRLFSKKTAEG